MQYPPFQNRGILEALLLEAEQDTTPEELVTDTIQANKGTYLLLIRLDGPRELAVGRLGTFNCESGWYAYVGSA